MKREKKRKRRYRWWLVITTAHTLSFSSPRACSPPATAQRDRHRPHSLCPPREGGRTKNVVVRSVDHTIVYSQQPHSEFWDAATLAQERAVEAGKTDIDIDSALAVLAWCTNAAPAIGGL
jgi:hypothetical protein